jgi:hypothetical protein
MSAIKKYYHDKIESEMRTEVKERPIIFSTEMVQAIIKGEKTQTRRKCKHQHWSYSEESDVNQNKIVQKADRNVSCPYGQPGDLLWVRETWAIFPPADGTIGRKIKTVFKADTMDLPHPARWRPSIHMPKSAARIWLRVKDVRVERVWDISDEEILAEGVRIRVSNKNSPILILGQNNKAIDFLPSIDISKGDNWNQHELLFAHWAELWCTVNGRQSWEGNPWVWVVEFEVASINGNPEFCTCEMPAKMHGKNLCWRCKKQFSTR